MINWNLSYCRSGCVEAVLRRTHVPILGTFFEKELPIRTLAARMSFFEIQFDWDRVKNWDYNFNRKKNRTYVNDIYIMSLSYVIFINN